MNDKKRKQLVSLLHEWAVVLRDGSAFSRDGRPREDYSERLMADFAVLMAKQVQGTIES